MNTTTRYSKHETVVNGLTVTIHHEPLMEYASDRYHAVAYVEGADDIWGKSQVHGWGKTEDRAIADMFASMHRVAPDFATN